MKIYIYKSIVKQIDKVSGLPAEKDLELSYILDYQLSRRLILCTRSLSYTRRFRNPTNLKYYYSRG